MTLMKGWRYVAFVGGFVGFTLLAMFPVIIQPLISTERYKRIREVVHTQQTAGNKIEK